MTGAARETTVGPSSHHATRTRLEPAARRALIVEAAGRLFADRGFAGTRLEDIASAAGVTKPVLYRHFEDKTALYLALLERHHQDLGGFAAAVPAAGDPHAGVQSLLDIWFAYVESHSYAWKLLFRDTGGGPEIRDFRRTVHSRARSVLAAMIDQLTEGRIPEAELVPLAELMRVGMASLVLWWLDEPSASRETVLAAMERVWLGLLSSGR